MVFISIMGTRPELYEEFNPGGEPWIDLSALCKLAASGGSALDTFEIGDVILSPAEQFGVIVTAGAYLEETGSLPKRVAAQRLLGPRVATVETEDGMVPCRRILRTCRVVRDDFRQTGAVPSSVRLGMMEVGPRAFMEAVKQVLCVAQKNETGLDVRVRSVDELPAFARRSEIQNLSFRNGWSIFPPTFEGRRVVETIRLQTWTAKPAAKRRR
jgi:hypothetical protein